MIQKSVEELSGSTRSAFFEQEISKWLNDFQNNEFETLKNEVSLLLSKVQTFEKELLGETYFYRSR